jgi:peptidyl-tRNA hydrolase, PTH1 family
MWLVVGLGNPGRSYESHRHNVGFMVVDALHAKLGGDAFRSKFAGEIARATRRDETLLLLKPQTFMNLSGQSVQPAAAFHKVEPSRVLVIHDELDVPFDDLRLKLGGGHAGHNGLRSIIQSLGTPEFPRLRIGIGRPPPTFKGEIAGFVLSPFTADERAKLDLVLSRAVESVLDVCARGLGPATNKLNTRSKPAKPKGNGASSEEVVVEDDSKAGSPPRSGA